MKSVRFFLFSVLCVQFIGSSAFAKSQVQTYVCGQYIHAGEPNQPVVRPRISVEVREEDNKRTYTFVEAMGFEEDSTIQKRPLQVQKEKPSMTATPQVKMATSDAKVEIGIPKDLDSKYILLSLTREETQGICVQEGA